MTDTSNKSLKQRGKNNMVTKQEMLKVIHKLRVGCNLTHITDEEMLYIFDECMKIKELKKQKTATEQV